jgi:PHD/YefM family antitoxin component YafN of YafNO toxin-antitoxin module
MQSISAQEIKRRGISAVDELLEEGPVYVTTRNQPRYVILDADRYHALLAILERKDHVLRTIIAQARLALARLDVSAGRVLRFDNADDLLAAIDAADDRPEDPA